MSKQETHWPEKPYKGLHYYGPEDRLLLSGRARDIDICVHFLADPQTRVLMLHGQTGCGKSSFLRAGLIPALEERGFGYLFLRTYGNADDNEGSPTFIRSGADPLGRIAEQVYSFAERPVAIRSATGLERHDVSSARLGCASIQDFVAVCRKPGVLMEALQALSACVPLTLVLILDQAEEVMTLADVSNDYRRQFFRFIREFSIANFPLKFLLALRKDYSGEFIGLAQLGGAISLSSTEPSVPAGKRDPLVKADIKIFLLSEFNEERVQQAIELPTLKQSVEGAKAPFDHYAFAYDSGVAKQIVADLFQATSAGAALPVMQIVCRDLFKEVCRREKPRTIDMDLYTKGQRISGPVDRHISESLQASFEGRFASAKERAEEESKGRLLLYKLVRRESDGSVHTNVISLAQLRVFAKEVGLSSSLDSVVEYLTRPEVLLLRTFSILSSEDEDNRRLFSLGHDVIGVVLREWKLRREEAEQRQQAERQARLRIRKAVFGASLLSVLVISAATLIISLVLQAKHQGEDAIKFEVLMTIAKNRENQNPYVAMTNAAHAIEIEKRLRTRELRPSQATVARQYLAHIVSGLPDIVPTFPNSSVGAGPDSAAIVHSPMAKSNGFIRVSGNSVDIVKEIAGAKRLRHFDLVDDSGLGALEFGPLLTSESRTGDVLALRKNPFAEDAVFVLRDDGQMSGPFGVDYFLRKADSIHRNKASRRAAVTDKKSLQLSGSTVALYLISTGDRTTPQWVFTFFVDASRGSRPDPFSVGPVLEKVEASGSPANVVPIGDPIFLDGYVVQAIRSPPASRTGTHEAPLEHSVTLNRYDLTSADSQPDRSWDLNKIGALESCNSYGGDKKPCDWKLIYRTDASDTLLMFGSSKSSDAQGWFSYGQIPDSIPNLDDYQRLVFLDVANGKTVDVDLDSVRKQCVPVPVLEASSSERPRRRPVKSGVFTLGTIDSLLFGFVSGASLDLVRIQNKDGQGVPNCLGTMYFAEDVNRWALTHDNQTLLAAGPATVLAWKKAWQLGRRDRERLEVKFASQENLTQIACRSGLKGHELMGEDWKDATGLEAPSVQLCAE